MESILLFFENLSTVQKLLWVVLVLMLCFLLETGMPLFQLKYRRWKHVGVNLVRGDLHILRERGCVTQIDRTPYTLRRVQ